MHRLRVRTWLEEQPLYLVNLEEFILIKKSVIESLIAPILSFVTENQEKLEL